jgi:hypothetical protein
VLVVSKRHACLDFTLYWIYRNRWKVLAIETVFLVEPDGGAPFTRINGISVGVATLSLDMTMKIVCLLYGQLPRYRRVKMAFVPNEAPKLEDWEQ